MTDGCVTWSSDLSMGKQFFGLVKIFKLSKCFLLYIALKCSPSEIVLEEHASITAKELTAQ